MTVYKRGSRWHYAFAIRGRRYRAAIPEARTKAQAERVEALVREQIYNGTYGQARKTITFRAFVTSEYLPIAKATTRKFSTNAGYQSRVLVEAFGDTPIDQLSHFQIEKWLLTLRGRYAGATINHFIRRLGAILNQAVAAGYLDAAANPLRLVRQVEEEPRAKRRLTREEEARIHCAARELGLDHVAVACLALVETGMRPSELFEMKAEQVDFAAGIIRPISYKIGRRRSGTPTPKARIVPLSDRAAALFRGMVEAAEAAGRERIYPYRDIKKGWRAACRRAGVEGFWLRWCRDEAASRWVEAGIDPFTVARLLGHSGPGMSMTYVRDFRQATVEKMNASNLPQPEREDAGLRLVNY